MCSLCGTNFKSSCTQLHFAMHASYAAFQKLKFEIFAQTHPSEHNQNFAIMPPSTLENSAEMLSVLPLLHISSYQIPITVPSFPHTLPCFQPTFTRRTSGHCLGILTAVNFCGCPRNSNKYSISYCMPPPNPFFSVFHLFLSPVLVFKGKAWMWLTSFESI